MSLMASVRWRVSATRTRARKDRRWAAPTEAAGFATSSTLTGKMALRPSLRPLAWA